MIIKVVYIWLMYCTPSTLYLLCIPLQPTAYTQSSEQFETWFLWFIYFSPSLSCQFFWRLSDWKHGQPSQAFHLKWRGVKRHNSCTSELPVIHKGKNQNQIEQLKISSWLILTLLHLIHVTSQPFSNHCHCPTYNLYFLSQAWPNLKEENVKTNITFPHSS